MILEVLILILAIPTGFLIAWMAKDELIDGQKWFRALIILGLLGGMLFYFYGLGYIALTCLFIAIVAFISLMKSRDKRWTKKRV